MQIDINKRKSFSVSLVSEGMDISQMKFRFCLEINEMVYSFPAEPNGDNLQVVLPPLAEKIKGLDAGKCKAYLETYTLNEDNKGYYLRPWEDEIELKKEPKISVNVQEEKDNSGIKARIVEDDEKGTSQKQEKAKEWPKPKEEKKHSRFGKKLSGDE